MPKSLPLVSHPPNRPVLIFDGDCNFCRGWITHWQKSTGDRVDYEPLQEVASRFPEIARAEFEREIKLIEPSGRVLGGAAAVFETLAIGGGSMARALRWSYRHTPGVRASANAVYGFVARHRSLASALTRRR